jgi:hypothetical protein
MWTSVKLLIRHLPPPKSCVGYLPDARAFERGGYQTWTGLHSFTEKGSDETVVETAVELLEQLQRGDGS